MAVRVARLDVGSRPPSNGFKIQPAWIHVMRTSVAVDSEQSHRKRLQLRLAMKVLMQLQTIGMDGVIGPGLLETSSVTEQQYNDRGQQLTFRDITGALSSVTETYESHLAERIVHEFTAQLKALSYADNTWGGVFSPAIMVDNVTICKVGNTGTARSIVPAHVAAQYLPALEKRSRYEPLRVALTNREKKHVLHQNMQLELDLRSKINFEKTAPVAGVLVAVYAYLLPQLQTRVGMIVTQALTVEVLEKLLAALVPKWEHEAKDTKYEIDLEPLKKEEKRRRDLDRKVPNLSRIDPSSEFYRVRQFIPDIDADVQKFLNEHATQVPDSLRSKLQQLVKFDQVMQNVIAFREANYNYFEALLSQVPLWSLDKFIKRIGDRQDDIKLVDKWQNEQITPEMMDIVRAVIDGTLGGLSEDQMAFWRAFVERIKDDVMKEEEDKKLLDNLRVPKAVRQHKLIAALLEDVRANVSANNTIAELINTQIKSLLDGVNATAGSETFQLEKEDIEEQIKRFHDKLVTDRNETIDDLAGVLDALESPLKVQVAPIVREVADLYEKYIDLTRRLSDVLEEVAKTEAILARKEIESVVKNVDPEDASVDVDYSSSFVSENNPPDNDDSGPSTLHSNTNASEEVNPWETNFLDLETLDTWSVESPFEHDYSRDNIDWSSPYSQRTDSSSSNLRTPSTYDLSDPFADVDWSSPSSTFRPSTSSSVFTQSISAGPDDLDNRSSPFTQSISAAPDDWNSPPRFIPTKQTPDNIDSYPPVVSSSSISAPPSSAAEYLDAVADQESDLSSGIPKRTSGKNYSTTGLIFDAARANASPIVPVLQRAVNPFLNPVWTSYASEIVDASSNVKLALTRSVGAHLEDLLKGFFGTMQVARRDGEAVDILVTSLLVSLSPGKNVFMNEGTETLSEPNNRELDARIRRVVEGSARLSALINTDEGSLSDYSRFVRLVTRELASQSVLLIRQLQRNTVFSTRSIELLDVNDQALVAATNTKSNKAVLKTPLQYAGVWEESTEESARYDLRNKRLAMIASVQMLTERTRGKIAEGLLTVSLDRMRQSAKADLELLDVDLPLTQTEVLAIEAEMDLWRAAAENLRASIGSVHRRVASLYDEIKRRLNMSEDVLFLTTTNDMQLASNPLTNEASMKPVSDLIVIINNQLIRRGLERAAAALPGQLYKISSDISNFRDPKDLINYWKSSTGATQSGGSRAYVEEVALITDALELFFEYYADLFLVYKNTDDRPTRANQLRRVLLELDLLISNYDTTFGVDSMSEFL